MTTLVTGATGFIGQRLVNCLLQDETNVRILTRGNRHLPQNWADKVEVWIGDLSQGDSLAGIADGIDTVYHLAGEIREAASYDAVNRCGTEALLTICEPAGVRRFLYLSSVGVMGAHGQSGIVDETTPAAPANGYEASKYAGEQVALLYHNANGMQVTILRPTIVYGEGRNSRDDSFLSWVQAIKTQRFVQLGQDYVSSYIYIGDVVASCLALVNSVKTGGEVYIVNEPIRLSTFIAELSATLGVQKPRVLPSPLGTLVTSVLRKTGRFASLYNRTIYCIDKLTRFGFTLPFGYQKGLRRTIQWYQEKGLL